MLDKLTSLSFSMHSNKGVYALFLGSGISSAAGIPTAWDIVKDLTRRIAITQGESDLSDPIKWYIDKYHDEPDYSDLLSKLVHTSSERKELLLPYFMPNEDNDKKPTLAHKAIANLIKDGVVKVVITTNFDRLLETALNDLGVPHQVIQHESEISGATPIVHSNCTILKINGDYLDCRFKNTIEELSHYSEELSSFLKEIFRDFGLITCGWSATWDKALVHLMKSSSNKRYFSFFTYRDKCSDALQDLASFKGGETIEIVDADSFFFQLYESVVSLNGIDRNIPLSKEIAIERMKKYISQGDEGIIRMNDLLVSEFDRSIENYNSHVFSSEYPSREIYDNAINTANIANEIIIPLALLVVKWGNRKHEKILIEQIERLFDRRIALPNNTRYYRETRDFNHIGSVLILYSIGVACIKHEKFHFLNQLLSIELRNQEYTGGNRVFNTCAIDCFNEWLIDKSVFNSHTYLPFINHVQRIIYNSYFSSLNENSFLPLFCIFERLLALYYGILSHINYNRAIGQIPIGTLQQRDMYNLSSYLRKDYDAFFNSIDLLKEKSEVIKQGMFKGSYSYYSNIKTKVDEFLENHRHGF